MKRKKNVVISAPLLNVVGDGAMAMEDLGHGAMIPVLVLDSKEFPDLNEAIQAAVDADLPGDVRVAWGRRKPNEIVLHIHMDRPLRTEFAISFDLRENHGILVDQIVTSKFVYLKAGDASSTFKSTFAGNAILMEVNQPEFDALWPKLYRASLMEAAKRQGMNLKEARKAGDESYEKLHRLSVFRMN